MSKGWTGLKASGKRKGRNKMTRMVLLILRACQRTKTNINPKRGGLEDDLLHCG